MSMNKQPPTVVLSIVWRYQVIVEAAITREGLERQLGEIERQVARLGKTRTEISDSVAGAFAAGRHETEQDRVHLAALLLWLAASDDKATADRLRGGGTLITWMINPPANSSGAWDLSYRLDDISPATDTARPTQH
jgi:hypothetical protein